MNMIIRQITKKDLQDIEEMDHKAYGEYGASAEYILKKLKSLSKGALVIERNGKIIGFVINEILNKDQIPEDFCDLNIKESFKGKWMHPVMFTTISNYKDIKTDSKLLIAAEKICQKAGCVESCVPLSKNHPFKKNGVFKFWGANGYRNIGEIKWKLTANQTIECFLFKKVFKGIKKS